MEKIIHKILYTEIGEDDRIIRWEFLMEEKETNPIYFISQQLTLLFSFEGGLIACWE
jgi:hypothetical protein